MKPSIPRGYVYVIMAACLWSTIGLLMRTLHDGYGLGALTLAFLRAGVAAAIALAALAIFQRDQLRLTRRALSQLALYGLIGVALFYWTYTNAIIQTSVTMAVVLLYTAPAFVTLIAWRVWREPLTGPKGIALVSAFVGCALVARAYDLTQLSGNWIGIFFGLGAGLTYALFTVFSKQVGKQFAPFTALTFELFFGAVFLAFAQTPNDFAPLSAHPDAWIFLLALVFGPTLGSIWFFTAGLRSVPASNASILATIEPVIASALAFVFLGERLEPLQLIGGAMVIGGAIWLNVAERRVSPAATKTTAQSRQSRSL